jgi:hypothetical protein
MQTVKHEAKFYPFLNSTRSYRFRDQNVDLNLLMLQLTLIVAFVPIAVYRIL